MTTPLGVQWRKELRELLPWWAAIVVGMLACWALLHSMMPPMVDDRFSVDGRALVPPASLVFGLFAYAAGAIVIGALSIGQEFSHGTLPALLAQPISRARLLLTKLAVLVPLLAALAALALAGFGSAPWLDGTDRGRFLMLGALPLACGLCLAPWMTMVCRGPVAGALFGAALPSLLWAVGSSFQVPFEHLWRATLALAFAGAMMTWRTFMRLEVTGGAQAEVDLVDWLRRPVTGQGAGRIEAPAWLLAKKELRLQQVTFVVSGAYALVWLAILVGRRLAPDVFSESALYITAGMHSGLVPVMIGALASAEERRFGTADWHTLLPLAAWKQWVIKSGIAIALAFALAWALPALLEMIAAEPGIRDRTYPAIAVLLLCVAALYVSSISTSGVRAFLTTFPVIAVSMFLVKLVATESSGPVEASVHWFAEALQPFIQLDRSDDGWWRAFFWWRGQAVITLAFTGFAVIVLRFAFTNQRTADRSRHRVVRQALWLCAYAFGAMFILQVISTTIALALSDR